jgi:hypothetical protein
MKGQDRTARSSSSAPSLPLLLPQTLHRHLSLSMTLALELSDCTLGLPELDCCALLPPPPLPLPPLVTPPLDRIDIQHLLLPLVALPQRLFLHRCPHLLRDILIMSD